MTGLHDHDFYAWTQEQASLLRAGKLNAVDIENIAEEIESMGRSEQRQLEDRLIVLRPTSCPRCCKAPRISPRWIAQTTPSLSRASTIRATPRLAVRPNSMQTGGPRDSPPGAEIVRD